MSETPNLVLFQCQWCLFAPADQEWVDTQLPENIHLAKVPCTGRINPLYLLNAVQGISDLITIPGLINVDFADVKIIMSNMGRALMGTGRASGERRAIACPSSAILRPETSPPDASWTSFPITLTISATNRTAFASFGWICRTGESSKKNWQPSKRK